MPLPGANYDDERLHEICACSTDKVHVFLTLEQRIEMTSLSRGLGVVLEDIDRR